MVAEGPGRCMTQLVLIQDGLELCPECCGEPEFCDCEPMIPRGKWEAWAKVELVIEHPALCGVPAALEWEKNPLTRTRGGR